MRLLVVDDDGLIRDSLKMMLSMEEDIEEVEVAENGQVALKVLDTFMPDVILMDIRMPVMDGVLTTKEVKVRYPDMKIVILTTFNDEDYLRELVKIGVDGYILKSTKVDQIVESIRSVYQGHVVFDKDVSLILSQILESKKERNIPESLTSREIDIIKGIGQGMSNKEISEELFIGEGTIRNYISGILDKLNLRDRTQLAIYYIRNME